MPSVTYQIEPTQVINALKLMNEANQTWEKGTVDANDKVNRAFQGVADLLLKINDKHRNSLESVTRAIEKQAEAYGKTGVERLIAQRDALIKRLGDEETLVNRVTAAYEKMIKAQGSEGEGGGENRFKEFGEKIKEWVEHPLQSAGGAVSGFLEKLGPVGTAFAGLGVGAVAVGVGLFEMAESAGEAAERIVNLAHSSGMSIAQTDKLSAMARIVGVDIGSLSRLGGQLSSTLDEGGEKAAKMAKALSDIGASAHDVGGNLKEPGELIGEVLEKLSHIPNEGERITKSFEILPKRLAGVFQPLIEDYAALNEAVTQLGYGNESNVIQADKFAQSLHSIELRWDQLKRAVAQPISVVFDYVFGPAIPEGERPAESPARQAARERGQAVMNFFRRRVGSDESLVQGIAAPGGLSGDFGGEVSGASGNETALRSQTEGIEKRYSTPLQTLQKELKDTQKAAEDLKKAGVVPTEDLPAFEADMKKIVDLQTEIKNFGVEERANEQLFQDALKFRGKLIEDNFKREAEARKQAQQAIEKDEHDRLQNFLETQKIEDSIRKQPPLSFPELFTPPQVGGPPGASYAQQIRSLQTQGRYAQRGGASDMESIQQEYDLRKQIADLELNVELERAKEAKNSVSAEYDARFEYEDKLKNMRIDAENQVQAIQQKQLESIRQPAQGLFHTLFTKPSEFGGQLTNTIKEAALKPITGYLSGVVADWLQPLFYGNKAQDPVKASTDMNTAVTAQNSAAVAGMTAVLAAFMGISAPSVAMPAGTSAAGISLPSISVSAPAVPGGGASSVAAPTPSGSIAVPAGSFPSFGGGTFPSFGGIVPSLGPGGTSGFAGPLNSLSGGRGIGGVIGGIRGLLSGGGGLGGLTRGPDQGLPGVDGQPGTDLGVGSGSITGVSGLAGQGLSLGGTILATQGLLGNYRGSATGILMGAGGGAAIGFAAGGPLGAAIGAGVGAAIGVGELLAGVEPQWKEAERLVKQDYGITINQQTGQQIANIANQKYAGHVSIAVRAPEVRQMLGLYAAGTGQKLPLSATTPYAGSLAEQNGTLYQQATYQYGNSLAYQSNLPLLGGPASQTIPSPGGSPNISLSLNVAGGGISQFLTGNVVTPDFVQTQYSGALAASNGRLGNSATIQQPGLIVS